MGGGANQNELGATVCTTADVAMEVGDCDDASASCARHVPSRQPVAYPRVPNHRRGMLDGELVAVNGVSHDAQGEAYHDNNNHNKYHGMAEEVDNSQVGMSLMNNSHVGGVDEGEVQELDDPT